MRDQHPSGSLLARVVKTTAASLIACGLVVMTACQQTREEPPREEITTPPSRATRVEVATLSESNARIEIRLPGEIVGSEDTMLAAAYGGLVERVYVSDGDTVRRGKILVKVDSASQYARNAQSRTELASATRELDRAERLGDALPRAQRDAAENRVKAARAAIRSGNVSASRSIIRAPFAGTAARVFVDPGEVAPPGSPVVRLVNLDPIHVELSVPDRDVVALREGMPVRVLTGARGEAHVGTVKHVSPAADLQTRAFRVVVEVPNPERTLLPGMIAYVSLAEEVEAGRVMLPQYVLVTRLEGNGVFVNDGGVARWRPLVLGPVIRDQVIVESGVTTAEQVIVTGHRELADGDAVIVNRSGRCCEEGRVIFSDVTASAGQAGQPVAPAPSAPEGSP